MISALFNGIYGRFKSTSPVPSFYTDIGGRMYLSECPQNTPYPNATFDLVSGSHDWDFQNDFDQATIQFNIYSESNSAVEITDAENKLSALYDDCLLATSDLGASWKRVSCHKDNFWLDKIPHPDSSGGGNLWRCVVEYNVMLTR